jgi:Flp pilus assembly CpaE family ATPase
MLPSGSGEGEDPTVVLELPVRQQAPEPESDAVRRRLALLETVAVFFALPDHALRKLARHLEPVKAKKGRILVALGERSERLFVIEEGLCELSIEPEPGESVPLLVVGERDVVGAASLLHDEPSPVSVRALRNCRLLALDRAVLLEVAPRDSELHQALKRVTAQRRSRLRDMASRARRTGPTATSSVVAVYSPKGGSGKTTIAVSLAATLAHMQRGEVVLFDLALPYNHAALMTQLTPTTSLARLAGLGEAAFATALEGAVLFHRSGLMVLPTALHPDEADLVTPDLVVRTLGALRRSFRYVVFDLGSGLGEPAVAALENADHLVAVATPELAALGDLGRLYPMLERVFRLPLPRVHLVVNHRSPNSAIGQREVKNFLRREVAAEIRYDGLRPEEAAVRGHLLTPGDPRSTVARGTAELARRIRRAEPATA